jgi:hypothetical protein
MLLERLSSCSTGAVESAHLDQELLKAALHARLVRKVPGVKPVYIELTDEGKSAVAPLREKGELLFGLQVTQGGVRIEDNLSREQYIFLFERLRKAHDYYHCLLADVIASARKQHGDQFVDETLEQLHFDFMAVQKAEAISAVPLLTRESYYQLSSEHLYVLGQKFPDDPTEQEKWAQLAVKHKLTALALKRSIDAGKVMTEEDITTTSGRGSGIVVINGLFQTQFRRWLNQVGGKEKILGWDPDTKKEFLDEVNPVVELAEQVRESLPEDEE